MPKRNKKLTELEIKNAKAKEADYKLYDEGGLRLLVRKTGTKVWQYPYKNYGKHNVYTIGKYPTVSTAEARTLLARAKRLLEQGLDPNQEKKNVLSAAKAETENTFENIAREWHSKQGWVPKHAQNILNTMETDVFPFIGAKNVNEITPQDIIGILRKIEGRNALDVAKRVSQRCTAVFDYAINLGVCNYNPAIGRGKIVKSYKVAHRPFLKEDDLPEFLSKLDAYHGSKIVKSALKLLLLTFVRPGELRNASWEEIDLEKAEWRIPAERMKMARPHIVPLPKQAVGILRELAPKRDHHKLVFPSVRSYTKPISDVTLLKVLQILGYTGKKIEFEKTYPKVVPHGMRSTASTILNEVGRFKPDVIERQLAHVEQNKVRAAYHHAEYLEERKEMMQWWADYLDILKNKAARQ